MDTLTKTNFQEIISFLNSAKTPAIFHQLDSGDRNGTETIEYHFHEFEKFSFEARILFNYNSVYQGEPYGWESEVTSLEIDLENTYNQEGEEIKLTTSQTRIVEEYLKSATDINLY